MAETQCQVMCRNDRCQLRENCFRYRAHPHPDDQTYGDFRPMDEMHGGKCGDFWDCKEYVESRKVPMEKLEFTWPKG